MPKGYWVSVYRTISGPEKLAAYNKLAAPAVQAGGGRTFARGGRVAACDAGIAERAVLIEFDSFEQAVAARESAAYQEALVASPTASSATSASSRASTDDRCRVREEHDAGRGDHPGSSARCTVSVISLRTCRGLSPVTAAIQEGSEAAITPATTRSWHRVQRAMGAGRQSSDQGYSRTMSNRPVAAGIGLARVMVHCGGSPSAAVHYLAGAIASAPENPEPYAVLAELWRDKPSELAEVVQGADSLRTVLAQSYISFLRDDMDGAVLAIGSVTGVRPDIAWAKAPWFRDERFLGVVSADAMAEAAMRTMDYGHDLDTESMQERFRPWFEAIDVVSARQPLPEALAKMAILLRACGLTDASFALCDQADSVERIMLTEVVRAGTWRKLGDLQQTVAAFERALALEPANWSLYLDLADVRAEQGDFTSAVRLIDQGMRYEPAELSLRAAGAAYRARLTGSRADLSELIKLAPNLPNDSYRDLLIDHACAGPALPAELVAAVRRIQNP